ncbi:uncharacterized protein LOC144421078 [Styela clava]
MYSHIIIVVVVFSLVSTEEIDFDLCEKSTGYFSSPHSNSEASLQWRLVAENCTRNDGLILLQLTETSLIQHGVCHGSLQIAAVSTGSELCHYPQHQCFLIILKAVPAVDLSEIENCTEISNIREITFPVTAQFKKKSFNHASGFRMDYKFISAHVHETVTASVTTKETPAIYTSTILTSNAVTKPKIDIDESTLIVASAFAILEANIIIGLLLFILKLRKINKDQLKTNRNSQPVSFNNPQVSSNSQHAGSIDTTTQMNDTYASASDPAHRTQTTSEHAYASVNKREVVVNELYTLP